MNLIDYLKALPIKRYNFFLMKKNKNKKLRFRFRDEELKLISIYKDTLERESGPFTVSPVNDMRRRFQKGIHIGRETEINQHDGIKIVFEYEDW